MTKAAANYFMKQETKTRLLVAAVACASVAVMAGAWDVRMQFPGLWPLFMFGFVAFLLDLSSSPLQLGAVGSTSFVVHLAAGILFGPFWGGLIAACATLVSQLKQGSPWLKVAFNVTQRALCVATGMLVYSAVGGDLPPAYLAENVRLGSFAAQRDLALFFLAAISYFATNTVLLNAVVACSSGRPFREAWNLNAKGVFGYDIAASTLAIVLAFVYAASERAFGLGVLGFAAVLAPILVTRHVYGLYRRLQSSGRELLDLMVKAIEARDPYTSGHSVRVASLAKAIAQEAKMSAEEVELVYTAAILHDVGKIHEEFAPLLRKDSKLTPEETALLQTHSVKSADLVGIISGFRGVVQDAVRSHHERWDGGGYPDGLVGDDIPLGARIIMISDTTDAMTTDRPYRKKLPIDAVISELQKYRGTQFDPRLVDIAVSSMAVRRVMSELQSIQSTIDSKTLEGGSKKVTAKQTSTWRSRASWPKIRAF
ncbi:MAG: HD-GYP domain-containing protein [Gemmatimonadales bacterium]